MLSDKDIELLSLLYNKEAPMSIKDLSDYFSVSERSIRYYVNNLNYELKEHGISIIKKICTLQDRSYVEAFYRKSAHSCTVEIPKRNSCCTLCALRVVSTECRIKKS